MTRGFSSQGEWNNWDQVVQNQTTALIRNVCSYLNGRSDTSTSLRGDIDTCHLSLVNSIQVFRNGGPHAKSLNFTFTSRTPTNAAKWDAAAASARPGRPAGSPPIPVAPWFGQVSTHPVVVSAFPVAERTIGTPQSSAARWNQLAANNVGVFAGQGPFNNSTQDEAKGLHLTGISAVSILEEALLPGAHNYLSSHEPNSRTNGGHTHVQVLAVIRKIRNAHGIYEDPENLTELINWLIWYYGGMPKAGSNYEGITAASHDAHIVDYAWSLMELYSTMNYIQKLKGRHSEALSEKKQRAHHSLIRFPCGGGGGFSAVSICNPKDIALPWLEFRMLKVEATQSRNRTLGKWFPIQFEGGNYVLPTDDDWPEEVDEEGGQEAADFVNAFYGVAAARNMRLIEYLTDNHPEIDLPIDNMDID